MLRDANGLTEEEFLAQYKPGDYQRPSVTTDMHIFTIDEDFKLNILLIKRKAHPFIENWALPGGFCNIDESLEDCARRELKEETGLIQVPLEQLHTFSEPNRDPRMRVISTSFIALVDKHKVKPQAGDDAKEAKWFKVSLEEPSNYPGCRGLILANKDEGIATYLSFLMGYNKFSTTASYSAFTGDCNAGPKLAFDHADQIALAITWLRNKIWQAPIAIDLLPKKFSLGELQKVYESILGEQLIKPNFRVRIGKFVEQTDEYQSDVAHRPGKLYRLKGDYLC